MLRAACPNTTVVCCALEGAHWAATQGTRQIRVILYAKNPSFRTSAFAVSHR